MLIGCRFLDENNEPKGREYIYSITNCAAVGEIVTNEDGKRLVVTYTDVPPEEGEKLGDKLKCVQSIVDAESKTIVVDETHKDLIVVKQLPIIEERLKGLSGEIDTMVNSALALPCTENNVKAVKAARTELNKTFEALEAQRMAVKNAIMAPYEQFNGIYKTYVSDKINAADGILKKRIGEVEGELKTKKETEIKTYFDEYLCSKNIDFITFADGKINVTLTASLKSLKDQAKTFIDRIADDLALIEVQEHKEEILVEYKRSLNCSQAITAVVARHKAIEEQKARQAELESKMQAQTEAVQKVEAAASTQLEPPKQRIDAISGAVSTNSEQMATLSFKVTAPISKLKALKAFLIEGGYKYE